MPTVESFIRERYWPSVKTGLSAKWITNSEILLEKLIAGLGQFEMSEVTTEVVETWWRGFLTQYKSPVTPNKVLIRSKHIFKTAMHWDVCVKNPFAHIKKKREPRRKFTLVSNETHDEMFQGASEKLQWYIIFARYTGARMSSLAKLEKRDVNLQKGEITFRETKNGEDYTIPIHPTLRPWIERGLSHGPKAGRLLPQYADVHSVSQLFRRLRLRYGVPFKFHDYRHNVGTQLAAKGYNTRTIMGALGHKDMKMSIHYQHLAEGGLKQAFEEAL